MRVRDELSTKRPEGTRPRLRGRGEVTCEGELAELSTTDFSLTFPKKVRVRYRYPPLTRTDFRVYFDNRAGSEEISWGGFSTSVREGNKLPPLI